MSGNCAQLTPHTHVMDRLKKRVGSLQQRSHESQIHLNATQAIRVEAERSETAKLLLKVQESNGQKRAGRHKSDSSFRTKYDQPPFGMRDSSEMGSVGAPMKRKMELTNGLHSNMYRPHGVFNGVDSFPPSEGPFNGDNGMEYAKKMKLDSDPKVLTPNGSVFGQSGSANNNNCNSGNLTHQQSNSFVGNATATQQETRLDVQVTPNPNNNVSFEPNHVVAQSPLTPFSQTEQPSPAQNAVMGTILDDLDDDLQSLLNDIEDGKFSNESQNETQQIVRTQQKNVERPLHINNQALPSNGTNNSSQLPYYNNSASQPQKIAPSPSAVQQQLSPYNNPPSNQMKTASSGQNQQQNNLTSPHLQNLTATIDTNFGSPVEQQTQVMSQPMSVNRIQTPSSVDKVSHTPEGIQPIGGAMTPSPGSYSVSYASQNLSNNAKRIQTPSSVDKVSHTPEGIQPIGGAMTPSPGSYSVSYASQNLSNNAKVPGSGGNSSYSPISPRGQAQLSNPVATVPNWSLAGQQTYMQTMPHTNQEGFPYQARRSITPGMTMPRGGMPMSPNDMNALPSGNLSQMQQMRQLQERKVMPSMAEQQRNAMTPGMAARNADINQLHTHVHMRNIPGQQSTIPNLSLTNQSNLSALQHGNINAATEAAQRAVAASQIQHDTAYTTRLPQYPNPTQRNSPVFSQQQAFPLKAMPHNCGNPNCNHNYQAQMTMRSAQPNMPINGLTRSMSGNPSANFNTSNPSGSYNRLVPDSNPVLHHSSSMQMNNISFSQRQRELENYKLKLVAAQQQQRELQQREMTQAMSHQAGHMMTRNLHPGGVPTNEKAAALVNRQIEYPKMNASANGASWNGLNYRSAQGGVDQHQNISYNSYPSRSYSFTSGRNFSSASNDFLQHSVSMDRGSTLQRSNPMANPVSDRLTNGQMLQNNPMPQTHMRNMYGSSQGMPSNSMLQGHGLVQNQMSHGFRSQSIPANPGINHAAYGM